MPERETAPVATVSYRVIEAEEQGQEESPCKKILLTARTGIGAPMTLDKLREFVLAIAAEIFPEDQGWDLREVSGEQELTLTLGKTKEAPEYFFEERKLWGESSLQFLPELTMRITNAVLEAAKAWIYQQRPEASAEKRNAFASVVMSMVTGWVTGTSSVRALAADRLYGEGGYSFEEALAILNRDDGPIFGPLTELHRQCWEEEFCFDDDPVDVAELTSSTSLGPDDPLEED